MKFTDHTRIMPCLSPIGEDGQIFFGETVLKRAPAILMLAACTVAFGPPGSNPDPPDEEDVPWLLIAPATREPEIETQEPPTRPDAHTVEITIEGEHRRIRSNGLPNHPTGRFPRLERVLPLDHQKAYAAG